MYSKAKRKSNVIFTYVTFGVHHTKHLRLILGLDAAEAVELEDHVLGAFHFVDGTLLNTFEHRFEIDVAHVEQSFANPFELAANPIMIVAVAI